MGSKSPSRRPPSCPPFSRDPTGKDRQTRVRTRHRDHSQPKDCEGGRALAEVLVSAPSSRGFSWYILVAKRGKFDITRPPPVGGVRVSRFPWKIKKGGVS